MTQTNPRDETPRETPGEETPAAPVAPAPGGQDEQIAVLEQKLAEANDKMLRALAEAENVRRRAARDREDTAKFAVSGFARDLLAVTDNLRRALLAITPEAMAASTDLKNIYVGVEMTERELYRVMEANGIRKIEPMGQAFDPNFHEVMFEAEMPGAAPGTVVQVVDPGYTIHGRLLRPARVGVAKGGVQPAGVDEQV